MRTMLVRSTSRSYSWWDMCLSTMTLHVVVLPQSPQASKAFSSLVNARLWRSKPTQLHSWRWILSRMRWKKKHLAIRDRDLSQILRNSNSYKLRVAVASYLQLKWPRPTTTSLKNSYVLRNLTSAIRLRRRSLNLANYWCWRRRRWLKLLRMSLDWT
jgi:hypothetical protein